MARAYTCDECGKEMNGDRATDGFSDPSSLVRMGPGLRLKIGVQRRRDDDYSALGRAQDVCWACLSRLLGMAAEAASVKAGELAAKEEGAA